MLQRTGVVVVVVVVTGGTVGSGDTVVVRCVVVVVGAGCTTRSDRTEQAVAVTAIRTADTSLYMEPPLFVSEQRHFASPVPAMQ